MSSNLINSIIIIKKLIFYKIIIKNIKILLPGALTSKPFAFQDRRWNVEKVNYFDFFSSELTSIKIQHNINFLKKKNPIIRVFATPQNYISNKIRFILNSVFTQKIVLPYLNNNIICSWKKTFLILKKNLFNLLNPTLLIDKNFSNFKTTFAIKFINLFRNLNLKFNNLNLKNTYFNYFNLIKLNSINSKQTFILINLHLRFENPKFFFKIRKFNLKFNLIKLVLLNSTFNKSYILNLGKNIFKNLKKIFFSKIKFNYLIFNNLNYYFFNSFKLNLSNFIALNFEKFKNLNFFTLFNNVAETNYNFLNLLENNLKNYSFTLLNFENDFLINLKNFNFTVFFCSNYALKNVSYNLIIPTLNLFQKSNLFIKNNYFIKLIRLINVTKNLNFLINLTQFFSLLIKNYISTSSSKKNQNYLLNFINFKALVNNFGFLNFINTTYFYYLTDLYNFNNPLNLLVTKKLNLKQKKNEFYHNF